MTAWNVLSVGCTWKVHLVEPSITHQITEGFKGNVRAALADLAMWMG
ncbi:MAG: hypothetical protein ACOVRB_07790 [Akkermansiaceae bacterium]